MPYKYKLIYDGTLIDSIVHLPFPIEQHIGIKSWRAQLSYMPKQRRDTQDSWSI